MRPGERGTAAEQRANLREACAALRPLLDGARARRHARKRPAGRQRAAAPGAGGRRGAAAAALPRGRADPGGDRRADRERARAGRRPAGRLPADPRARGRGRPGLRRADQAGRPVLQRGAGACASSATAAGRSSTTRAVAGAASCPRRCRSRWSSSEAIRSLLASGSIVVACGGGGIPATQARRAPRRHRRRDRQGPRLLPAGPRARRRPARDPDRGARRLLGLRHRRAAGAARARAPTTPRRSSPSSRPARCGRRSRRASSSSARPATRP